MMDNYYQNGWFGGNHILGNLHVFFYTNSPSPTAIEVVAGAEHSPAALQGGWPCTSPPTPHPPPKPHLNVSRRIDNNNDSFKMSNDSWDLNNLSG